MSKTSLRSIILKYLRDDGGLVNGGEIERLALENGFKASNASRRLRELENDELIVADYNQDSKHTVWYRAAAPKEIIQYFIPTTGETITKKVY